MIVSPRYDDTHQDVPDDPGDAHGDVGDGQRPKNIVLYSGTQTKAFNIS